MSDRLRYLILSLDTLLFLLCLLGIYHVAEKAGVPTTFSRENNQILVTKITSDLPKSDLQISDLIQSVNGYSVSLPEDIEFILDGLQIGDQISFEIERNGIAQTVTTRLYPYYGIRYILIILIVGILFFGIGVFVFIKRPDRRLIFFTGPPFVSPLLLWLPGAAIESTRQAWDLFCGSCSIPPIPFPRHYLFILPSIFPGINGRIAKN